MANDKSAQNEKKKLISEGDNKVKRQQKEEASGKLSSKASGDLEKTRSAKAENGPEKVKAKKIKTASLPLEASINEKAKPGKPADKKGKKEAIKKAVGTKKNGESISSKKAISTQKVADTEQIKEEPGSEMAGDEANEITLPENLADKRTTLRRVIFRIKFSTVVGQALFVSGSHGLLGDNDPDLAFPLKYLNKDYWSGTLDLPERETLSKNIPYHYVLKNTDGSVVTEWGGDKYIPATLYTEELLLRDYWNDSSLIENTFYTEPFQQVLLKNNFTEANFSEPGKVTHIFRAKAPLLSKGQVLCICGSDARLGAWKKPLLLLRKPSDIWYARSVDLSEAGLPLSYKYGVYDTVADNFVGFEDGENRILNEESASNRLTLVSDGFALLQANGFKGAGVAIPVFSLRTEKSFGVGEFTDLALLIDWAKQVGLKLVQLLPLNDTTATHTYTDSYPYAAISAFALHPLYLNLPAVLFNSDDPVLESLIDKQQELNSKAEVDYVAVMAAKWDFLKQVFPGQKAKTFEVDEFKAFFEENNHWLVPYAAFSYFREKYNTSDFSTWPSNQTFSAEAINAIASPPAEVEDEISIYYFVQYHLHLQLKAATAYAHANGIIVKGDIPIGIYRNSCDAWQQPELYNMDMQAGAPPDDFAVKGQNWGFPTYNWQKMREDGFTWWKKRFTQMSYYFDAFRIDHILGFFRIWSIPMHAVQGIMGHFVPSVPVYLNEITGRGIAFSRERFCRPYINDDILLAIFDAVANEVKAAYLEPGQNGLYSLKAEFDTQRKVEAYFVAMEAGDQNDKIKEGLYDLISNVILFEADAANDQFHFRISMTATFSYRYLDDYAKNELYDLYINYFFRRQDDFWRKEAMLKLPELKRSTNMLICGEDLGMVPDCVPGVMRELAILSLEIQRMPKDPSREFFHPNDAPYLSVVTPSTHDMSTVRGWWEEDRAATQRFFNSQLGQWGTAPYFCEPWINRIILLQHLYSPAMWSIFQLQDLLGISAGLRRQNPQDERINIPADPKHYWRYRMHLTLEKLISETAFTAELSSYVKQSGR